MSEDKGKNLNPRDSLIGKRIFERRSYLNLTQGQVAQRMGTSRSTIGHWENGWASVTAADLERLAHILRCSVSYFYGQDLPLRVSVPEEIQQPASSILRLLQDVPPGSIRDRLLSSLKAKMDAACQDLEIMVNLLRDPGEDAP